MGLLFQAPTDNGHKQPCFFLAEACLERPLLGPACEPQKEPSLDESPWKRGRDHKKTQSEGKALGGSGLHAVLG
jgi:hypothetical protein